MTRDPDDPIPNAYRDLSRSLRELGDALEDEGANPEARGELGELARVTEDHRRLSWRLRTKVDDARAGEEEDE